MKLSWQPVTDIASEAQRQNVHAALLGVRRKDVGQ